MTTREKIRLLRQARQWSQEYVAEKLSISPTSYGDLERGKSQITVDKLEDIAELFEVPPVELLSDNNEKNTNIFSGDQHNTNGSQNQNKAQFQINVYSPEYLEIKQELEKQRTLNEVKNREMALLLESKNREIELISESKIREIELIIESKNEKIVGLEKIILLLENKLL